MLGPVDLEMSFTRRPGLGRPRQTSRREDSHIVRNARIQLTASLAAIQAHVAPSLGAHVSSETIRRRLGEGHLGLWLVASITCAASDTHPSTSPFEVVPRTRKQDCNGIKPGRLQRRIQIQSQQ
ncbi:HTH_Tnp_Tc3_2 domain-containing protein [Trichonephila clavipes]|nr:HTH_Tnp_Tc3_2 domain-containing protein [Trichonephila clavipes]